MTAAMKRGGRGAQSALEAALANVATPTRGARLRNGGSGTTVVPEASQRTAQAQAGGLEDVLRRKGIDEAWNLLEEMQRRGDVTDKYTVSRMLMKTVGDGRGRLNGQRIYRCIAIVEKFIETQPGDVDEVLFNALLDTCCRLKDLGRLEVIVNRMRELKVCPSPVTLGILVKTYGQAGDLVKVLQVWDEMEKQRAQANAVTYGCMIDACVKCGNLSKAIEIFHGMRAEGKHRNTILYTTLIKGFGLEKDLSRALELFREMPREGVPYNTITYNSIIDCCIKCQDLVTAEGLLREMTSHDSPLEPDLITYSTILKGYCYNGELDRALNIAEQIKAHGLRCDELVYNTLMDGCVKANDVATGLGLFEEMVTSGMQPSTITHSILARLYRIVGPEENVNDAITELYQHHGLERPSGSDRNGRGAQHRKWNGQRSPGGRGERAGQHTPLGTSSRSGGRAYLGEMNDASCWNQWGESPLHGFDGMFHEHSSPSTPMGSSVAPSPLTSGTPCMSIDEMNAVHAEYMQPHPMTSFGAGNCSAGFGMSPSHCTGTTGVGMSPMAMSQAQGQSMTPPWQSPCATMPRSGICSTAVAPGAPPPLFPSCDFVQASPHSQPPTPNCAPVLCSPSSAANMYSEAPPYSQPSTPNCTMVACSPAAPTNLYPEAYFENWAAMGGTGTPGSVPHHSNASGCW